MLLLPAALLAQPRTEAQATEPPGASTGSSAKSQPALPQVESAVNVERRKREAQGKLQQAKPQVMEVTRSNAPPSCEIKPVMTDDEIQNCRRASRL